MRRAIMFLAACTVMAPMPWRSDTNRDVLKNPVRIRVTAARATPVTFTVLRRQGFISPYDHPLHQPQDTLRCVTPQELIGSGGQFILVADAQHPLRVEAWRMSGDTQHVVGEGPRITVRAPMANGVPEVLVDTVGVTASRR